MSSVGFPAVKTSVLCTQVLVFFFRQSASTCCTQFHRFKTCIPGGTGSALLFIRRGWMLRRRALILLFVASSFANPGQGYTKSLHPCVLQTSPLRGSPSAHAAPPAILHRVPAHLQNGPIFLLPPDLQSLDTVARENERRSRLQILCYTAEFPPTRLFRRRL